MSVILYFPPEYYSENFNQLSNKLGVVDTFIEKDEKEHVFDTLPNKIQLAKQIILVRCYYYKHPETNCINVTDFCNAFEERTGHSVILEEPILTVDDLIEKFSQFPIQVFWSYGI